MKTRLSGKLLGTVVILSILLGTIGSIMPSGKVYAGSVPVAIDDFYSTQFNTPLYIEAPGILLNDSDDDGDHLTVAYHTIPANGDLELLDDGSFTYTPDAGFAGTDFFTYGNTDSSDGNADAFVTIEVYPEPNSPPQAEDDFYSTKMNIPFNGEIGVLVNDFDPNGDVLTMTNYTQPSHGAVDMDGDGTFVYTPINDFLGTDAFTYTASDGEGGYDNATVTIEVYANSAPEAIDDSYINELNMPLAVEAPGVL